MWFAAHTYKQAYVISVPSGSHGCRSVQASSRAVRRSTHNAFRKPAAANREHWKGLYAAR